MALARQCERMKVGICQFLGLILLLVSKKYFIFVFDCDEAIRDVIQKHD